MEVARLTGRGVASRKYDILSALMAYGLHGDPTRQRRVLRLMSLITTRYNWQRDELSMGQAEIARLWCVDPRTVKREMAGFRAAGWLVLRRQGVRGRVSLYGLDLDRVLADTEPAWPAIGPDFLERMGQGAATEPSNVVPLRPAPVSDGGAWSAAQAILHGAGGAEYGPWLHALTEADRSGPCLILRAPTRFHASYVRGHLAGTIRMALRRVDPTISDVRIEGP